MPPAVLPLDPALGYAAPQAAAPTTYVPTSYQRSPVMQATSYQRGGDAAIANRSASFNLGTALSALGQVSTVAFPWYAEVNRHEEAQRFTRAQERVGLASFGAGRADTYALTPQPFAFDAVPRSTSVRGGGGASVLGSFGAWLPIALVAIVLVVLMKR